MPPPDARSGPGAITPQGRPHADSTDTASVQAGGDIVADLLAASDERDLWERRVMEAWCEGYRAGDADAERQHSAGYAEAIAHVKAAEHALYNHLAKLPTQAERWHVCCRSCRRTGHRPHCADCQDRTRATFACPHPGDYGGGPLPLERPGEVWLAGPAVHRRHACVPTCYEYRPGWYLPPEAERILATLPGRARREAA